MTLMINERRQVVTQLPGSVAQLAADAVSPISEKGGTCHTAVAGEKCYTEVLYQKDNIGKHPNWFPGLDADSSLEAIQAVLAKQDRCPMPCDPEGDDELPDSDEALEFLADRGDDDDDDDDGDDDFDGDDDEDSAGDEPLKLLKAKKSDHAAEHKGKLTRLNLTDAELERQEMGGLGRLEEETDLDSQLEREEALAHGEDLDSEEDGADYDDDGSNGDDDEDEDECHRPPDSSNCSKGVLWVQMDGIFANPEWYEGIHVMSSFEEIQGLLRQNPDGVHLCPKPCKCYTAQPGDGCYERVSWVLKEGLARHSDWYTSLDLQSRFEDIQDFLHRENKSQCPRPCSPPPWGTPSLYCYSVIRTDTYELNLMREQLRKNAGIFGCDEFTVYSNDKSVDLGVGGVLTVPFLPAPVGTSKDNTAGNSELFMHVWDAVKQEARYRMHDWSIKTDPDAVLLPARLRQHIKSETGAVYFRNCDVPGSPSMYGSVEAITREAMDLYFEGSERCKNELPWQQYGEDLYMQECLEKLGARSAIDLHLVGDGVCRGSDCSDGVSAAYHPFKDVDSWFNCWHKSIEK